MTAVRKELRRRRRPIGLAAMLVALTAVLVFAIGANTASLPGSNFEIDGAPNGSNFIVDLPAPSLDWANVDNVSQPDLATGQDDDSYKGGVKEDTACPDEVTGSIPNNKSDLRTFLSYTESEAGGPGFLNLGWIRVTDPSGTTLMDFELNHSSTPCPNGPNVIRTEGDLLIEYAITQGGAVANITAREWTGTVWGAAIPIPAQAIGTINLVPIPAAQTDGNSLVPLEARTFGEMSLDLDFIFDEGTCESFGSAMLKSRSSDAFSSQLKDFIRPVPVNITNCGKVIIRKQTNPDEDPNTTQFDYEKSFSTDPATGNTFNLTDDESETFEGVLFGDDYTVEELDLPAGWDFESLNCDDSTADVEFDIVDRVVTFDIDNAADILDCTYTNRARGTIIIEKITDDGQGAFNFTSNTLVPAAWTLTTTAPGAAGKDSRTFGDLSPGTYDASETVPAGWNLVSETCDDNSDPQSIGLSGGETVTCTFVNARERGAIDITKLRKHAADGPGDHPHPGVVFTVTGGELPVGGVEVTTDINGRACADNLLLSSFAGAYTVTETLPGGYHNVGPLSQNVSVVAEASGCGDEPHSDADVEFNNMPLTNVTISVNSQVDGGTASSWECDNGGPDGSTGANGDGSSTATDLEPVELHCTITIDP
jgi:hypothetical protein